MITKMIRNLTSKTIKVLEPHSDVTLQKLQAGYMGLNGAYSYYYWTMDKLKEIGFDPELDALVFPDKGAMNRYANRYPEAKNLIVGSKNRDFATGEIISITAELVKGTATVRKAFVIDDICSYGGTFKRLKTDALVRLLPENTEYVLVVTHAENAIINGGVLAYYDEVHATNSLYSLENEVKAKIHIHNILPTVEEKIK